MDEEAPHATGLPAGVPASCGGLAGIGEGEGSHFLSSPSLSTPLLRVSRGAPASVLLLSGAGRRGWGRGCRPSPVNSRLVVAVGCLPWWLLALCLFGASPWCLQAAHGAAQIFLPVVVHGGQRRWGLDLMESPQISLLVLQIGPTQLSLLPFLAAMGVGEKWKKDLLCAGLLLLPGVLLRRLRAAFGGRLFLFFVLCCRAQKWDCSGAP